MFIVDGREMKDNLLRERLILSNYDRRALSSGGGSSYGFKFPRMSNHYFNATFIANESEIFYNAEIRKSGSPFTRDGELHWRMESGNFLVIDYLEKEGEMFLMLQAHPRAVVLLDSMMTE